MSRATVILNNPRERQKAASWVQKAPLGTRVEFKARAGEMGVIWKQ